jgi:hypothetical protein
MEMLLQFQNQGEELLMIAAKNDKKNPTTDRIQILWVLYLLVPENNLKLSCLINILFSTFVK